MAFDWGSKKGDEKSLMLELAKAQVKCELYEEMISNLNKQVERLQEALVASVAPRAYDQIQMDKVDTTDPDPKRAIKEEEDRVLKEYMEAVEGPTFKDADDLVSSLGALIGVNPGRDSLHSNSES
jgi:hypothetical protein